MRFNIEITKELEGKVIYAIPTGNNIRRDGANSVEEFLVVKVKRKYVDLRKENSTLIKTLCSKTGGSQEEINSKRTNNSGYLFFKSEEDLEMYRTYQNQIRDLRGFFCGLSWDRFISSTDVASIHKTVSKYLVD